MASTGQEGTTSKRRQPKSRAGCNTCKIRRMKCDESKPSCSQCTDRGVECGGYTRDLKWKLVRKQTNEPRRPKKQSQDSQMESSGGVPPPFHKDLTPDDQLTTSPLLADTNFTAEITRASNAPSARFRLEHVWSSLPHGQSFDFTDVDFSTDLFLENGNMDLNAPTDLGSNANTPSAQLSEDVGNHVLSSFNATNYNLRMQTSPDYSALIFSPNYKLQDFVEIDHSGDDVLSSSGGLQDAIASLAGRPSQQVNQSRIHNVIYKQLSSLSDSPETVMHLFDKHLCNVLSMKDDHTTNPWRIHVWPLADRCPALYHALAAMTYLYMSNSQPQFHEAGLRNLHASLQAFAEGEDNAEMSLETSLSFRLAVGFAEAWDDQQASCGMEHIRVAGNLVRDAFYEHQTRRLTGNELDRLSFLARTWMYKDVMIRLTNSYDGESVDIESIIAYLQIDPLPSEQQLDPLLGCAITLFPLIGRLGDIIRSVRGRSERHNSPSIISRGVELRMAIEGWSPFLDPQQLGGLTSHISDVIQTAEAYRWAALLLLRHAVPELPWTYSIWELSEKVSIYLATIPVTSRTMIVQSFPLMVIGGEAFEEEDRTWVRQRWDAMSKCMPIASLDKCKRVTEEVWQRRAAFEAQCGVCPSCGAYILSSAEVSPDTDTLTAAGVHFASSNNSEEGSRRCRCSAANRIAATVSKFPDSLAFKKGVDQITRTGKLHYTVRGDLHWMGVMKDWDWDVMFG